MLLSRVKELEGIEADVDSKGLEYENVRLKRLLYKSLHIGINADDIDQYGYFGIILEEAAKELSLSIHCLELSTRVKNGLTALEIKTVVDLLHEIRDYKMERIRKGACSARNRLPKYSEAAKKGGWISITGAICLGICEGDRRSVLSFSPQFYSCGEFPLLWGILPTCVGNITHLSGDYK